MELTPKQVALLERANPCYRERRVKSSRPDELLYQDTYLVGGVGKIYLHTILDTYGFYAFGSLYAGRVPEAAVAVLHNDVLPFYAERDIPVGATLTDKGREFCSTDTHHFELYLALYAAEHRRTKVSAAPRPTTSLNASTSMCARSFSSPRCAQPLSDA